MEDDSPETVAMGLELLAQCTTHLRLNRTTLSVREVAQLETIRDSLLDILTESNHRRLCTTLLGLSSKLGHVRYGYSQTYWDDFLRYYHAKTTLER